MCLCLRPLPVFHRALRPAETERVLAITGCRREQFSTDRCPNISERVFTADTQRRCTIKTETRRERPSGEHCLWSETVLAQLERGGGPIQAGLRRSTGTLSSHVSSSSVCLWLHHVTKFSIGHYRLHECWTDAVILGFTDIHTIQASFYWAVI